MNTRFDPILLLRFVKVDVPDLTEGRFTGYYRTLLVDAEYEFVYSEIGHQIFWLNDPQKPLRYNLTHEEFYYVEHSEHKPNRDLNYN